MSPRCIVSDLDRTLTGKDLVFDPEAGERIRTLRKSGIRIVIATGRRLDELEAMGLAKEVDGLVAENGAIVSIPAQSVTEVRHADFGDAARRALGDAASAFTWGRVIGSGSRDDAIAASEKLSAAGVPHAIEFNAQEGMLLPAGVNKASGSTACLARLGLTAEDAWAVGDGENDIVLLQWARVGAAPANATHATLDAADVRLEGAYSKGFLELTDPLAGKSVAVGAPSGARPHRGA